MVNAIVEARKRAQDDVAALAQEQSATLFMQGLNPDKFRAVCQEALVSVNNLHQADRPELGKALRTCVQMGLVPNGREAALFVNAKNGSVTFWAMVDGWCKIAHRMIGVTIKSGHILEGDQFELTNTDEGDKFTHTKGLSREKQEVIGAYACFKRPGFDNFIHVWDATDIKTAEQASKMRGNDGPWEKWRGRMAEKGVVKSGIIKAMRMFPALDTEKADFLAKVVDDDTQEDLADSGTLVIDHQEPIEEVEIVTPEPEEKAKPTPAQIEAENRKADNKVASATEPKPAEPVKASAETKTIMDEMPW